MATKKNLQRCKENAYNGGVDTENLTREHIKTAGGAAAVASLFNITPQAVGLWYSNGVPAEKVLPLCGHCYYRVTPHQLRPDIYPHPDDGLPASLRVSVGA